jgi:hypothetical protein
MVRVQAGAPNTLTDALGEFNSVALDEYANIVGIRNNDLSSQCSTLISTDDLLVMFCGDLKMATESTEAAALSSNDPGLYPGSVQFESRLGD